MRAFAFCRILPGLALLASLALLAGSPARAQEGYADRGEAPAYAAGDPDAPEVTADNLMASERFWPFRVALVRDWTAGAPLAVLPKGRSGILIRVVSPGIARVDFARSGRFELPLDALDLVERANRIRLGAEQKLGPNLTQVIGAQTVDSETLLPVPYDEMARKRGFLCVFADPNAADFPALAAELAALPPHARVGVVLFAQGDFPPITLASRLRDLGWRAGFVFDHMSEGLAAALLPDGTRMPTLMLMSAEGRALFQADWTPGSTGVAQLTGALESAYGSAALAKEGDGGSS